MNYTSTTKNIIRYAIDGVLNPNIKNANNIPVVVSNYFKGVSSNSTNKDVTSEPCISQRNVAGLHVCVDLNNNEMNTLALFKSWLSTHNTEVLYVLATGTTETITDENLVSQLNELYYLQSYNDTTNIDVTGNLPMRITASAIKGE